MTTVRDTAHSRPPRRAPLTQATLEKFRRADRAAAAAMRRAPLVAISAYAAVSANAAVRANALRPLDYSEETQKALSTPFLKREFIRTFSVSSRLRGCGSVFLQSHRRWNSCGHALCDVCARQRASSQAASLAAQTNQYDDALAVTLSIESMPSIPLAAAWDLLDAARRRFVANWLKTRVDAWRWSTEVTFGEPGWHPHAAFLVFGTEIDLPQLDKEIRARWGRIVASLGYSAEPQAQYVERIARTRGKALRYAQKGLTAGPVGSMTPGALLDAAAAGDAAAAAQWIEIDAATHGRRLQGTGGQLRQRVMPMNLDALLAEGWI